MATVLGPILTSALRAAKAPEGGSEEDELKQLLLESTGKDKQGQPFYRYAYAAADFLYSNPDRLTKGKNGLSFVDVADSVIALLRRQVRLDATAEAEIPAALSAQKLLDEVLAARNQSQGGRRKASLTAV